MPTCASGFAQFYAHWPVAEAQLDPGTLERRRHHRPNDVTAGRLVGADVGGALVAAAQAMVAADEAVMTGSRPFPPELGDSPAASGVHLALAAEDYTSPLRGRPLGAQAVR